MIKLRDIYSTLFILFLFIHIASAQEYKELVELAWKNNEMLKSKNFQLQSATIALQEAKAMYGPEVKFGTQYTLASGGRRINFPVGDLLNPVYSTLNQVTQTNAFPQIENVNEQFLPNNFYDARVRVTQAIYHPDLIINKKVKSEIIQLKALEIKAFKRQISKETMIAQFQYEMAGHAVDVYTVAEIQIAEAIRTTESMIKNGIALPSARSRIENQKANIEAQKTDALAAAKNAERYFRFILGVGEDYILPKKMAISPLPDISNITIQTREEVTQLKRSVKVQNLAIEKENQFYKPRLGAQMDIGSQDFDFGFSPYLLAGINLEINIFDNKRHKLRIESVKADMQSTQAQTVFMEDQLGLAVSMAKESLISSISQARTFDSRVEASRQIFSDVLIKYKEGTAGYLELIDAQSQVTQTELQSIISRYAAWSKWAEYVYVTASYPID